MFVVSTIVITIFAVLAIVLFALGLMKLYRAKDNARGLLTGSFVSVLVGIIATAIIFNFFNV